MSFTTELAAAADADLVVEAAIENLDIKKSIFAELDSLCKPETILASNTSSISITAIAAATKRPDKFIGMHFFNPATVMKLVEVIRGAHTSDETYKTIAELAAAIGKEPVEVNEAPGFVVNKILVPMINEGSTLVYTGVASVEGVDTAMKLGANHPMGPLALGDLIGLDVCLAIMDTLYDETRDPKYRASRCCARWSAPASWAVRPARLLRLQPRTKTPVNSGRRISHASNDGREAFDSRSVGCRNLKYKPLGGRQQMDSALFPEQQQMLRKMYRDFAENEVKPLAEWVDETSTFPEETVKKMAKLGMMGIYFPKE